MNRLRLSLEGRWKMALEGDCIITPKLEAGMRQDGGDAKTGLGVEVIGGLAWVGPMLGLSLDLSGRTLIAHGSDDLEDRGFAASLAFDPDPATQRGPSLTLNQGWGGQAIGGLDACSRRRRSTGAAVAAWLLPLEGRGGIRLPGLLGPLYRQPACGAGARDGCV